MKSQLFHELIVFAWYISKISFLSIIIRFISNEMSLSKRLLITGYDGEASRFFLNKFLIYIALLWNNIVKKPTHTSAYMKYDA